MKLSVKTLIFMVLGFGVLISFDIPGYGNTEDQMKSYMWKNRPLLIFSQSPDNPAYQSVLDTLSTNLDQMTDRHMVIIEVFETGMVRTHGEPDNRFNAADLREQFSIQKGKLTVVLVGKDGGLKLKKHDRLNLDDIFSLIDQMPMRQQEMRDHQNPD